MSADNIFKSLRSKSEQQVRLLHHIENLRQYSKFGTPPGLKIKLTPQTIGKPSNRLTKRWEQTIDNCSHKLGNLLLNHSVNKTQKLGKLISEEMKQLASSTTPSEHRVHLERIATCEDKLSNQLGNTRKRKFARDGIPNPDNKITKPRNRRFQRRSPTQSTNSVINLSKVEITETETKLLSKGLNFCPKPTTYDNLAVKKDLEAFFRRLRLKDFFADTNTSDNSEDTPRFRKKSDWKPPKSKDPALEAYIQAVETEVMSHRVGSATHDNLTRTEKDALFQLKQRQDIVIKPADKGSAVVIMDTDKYIAEAHRQLSDKRFYQSLDHDPTLENAEKVTELLQEIAALGHIDLKTLQYLIPENSKPGRFYLLPKIHKPGCPGRPIISANDHPTEQISEFLDFHLAPLVEHLPSYIQDTTDFLRKVASVDIPTGSTLFTMDVTSLYTNIPHSEGIAACKEAWDSREDKSVPTKYLVKLLKLVLNLNNFEFNGQHYTQINGTAMGTKMAPSYANLFMGKIEKSLMTRAPSIPRIWLRFIDDIFGIWIESETLLSTFIELCNAFHPTIKFTSEHSHEHVIFLDTTSSIINGEIVTDLYTKPTDTHQYLLPSSCHPPHCAKNIPFSLAIRLRRICSTDTTFSSRCVELRQHLVNRSYSSNTLETSIKKARETQGKVHYSTRKSKRTDEYLSWSHTTQTYQTYRKSHDVCGISRSPPSG
jgi:hypothetical protein